MKGKLLRVLDVFHQMPLPTFYPPPGARVLCVKEHPGLKTGDPWFEVLYRDRIYAVDMYMVKECEVEKLELGDIIVLNGGGQAVITNVHSSEELGMFFTVLTHNRTMEISALDIKEIVSPLGG